MNPSGDRGKPKPKKYVRPIRYNYQIDAVLARRKALREAVEFEFLDKTPRGESFERLVSLIQEILPEGVRYDVLEDSLRGLAGATLDAKTVDDTCWRIAGNVTRLKQRRAVPPWHVQRAPEWVPAQVVATRPVKTGKGKMGAEVSFRVLAGTSCPRVIVKWWSTKMCRFYSKEFGWSRSGGSKSTPPRYPYSVPQQLVGLRCYLLVTPEESQQDPGFLVPGFPPSVRAYNLDVIRRRLRAAPGLVCPVGNPRDFPCHQCPVGYGKCRAATHRLDWVRRACKACGEKKAWFDPEQSKDKCIDCTVKAAYRTHLN